MVFLQYIQKLWARTPSAESRSTLEFNVQVDFTPGLLQINFKPTQHEVAANQLPEYCCHWIGQQHCGAQRTAPRSPPLPSPPLPSPPLVPSPDPLPSPPLPSPPLPPPPLPLPSDPSPTTCYLPATYCTYYCTYTTFYLLYLLRPTVLPPLLGMVPPIGLIYIDSATRIDSFRKPQNPDDDDVDMG